MIEYEDLRAVNQPFVHELKQVFDDVLNKGWYILGAQVLQFEQAFARYHGASQCIGVASGLDALVLALKVWDFPANAEVIVPANTYIATILSILNAGLKPVLVEPDLKTYNIDVSKIEEKITSKTVAIIVVHLYGNPCKMGPVVELSHKYSLKLIEDCAQAHGATYQGRKVGTFGLGAFSFYPTKNLGALGDGGAILTSDCEIANKLKALRNYGALEKNKNEHLGINSRLDEIQAGFLNVKLKQLDAMNEHKRQLAKIYQEGLKDIFIKPHSEPGCQGVFHIYPVRHPQRDALKDYLLKNGIKSEIHYPIPPTKQKALKGRCDGDYPLTEEIHRTILSLPLSCAHTTQNIIQVVEVMNQFHQVVS
ncbi:DegT/DnrJ/EryC1/StrS family aminotransferase [Deltaproteobacteria bacterium TL4]